MSDFLRTFSTKPEPASEPQAPRCDLLTTEECDAMDSTFDFDSVRTASGFITFDPVPLNTMQRIERSKQEEAMRAGTQAGMDTWFGMLEPAT